MARFGLGTSPAYPCVVGIAAAAVVLGILGVGPPDGAHPDSAAKPVGGAAAGARPRYDRDIRPILSDRCFQCHGPDAAKRKAELRLDQLESAMAPRKDGPAVAPGDPDQSELWRRISASDPQERMPPADSGKRPLTAAELDLVRRWIATGAEYEPHWAFVAPARPAVPDIAHPELSQNAIDRFIQSRLEAEGIQPAPEADKPALLRRVFLDLTGLPPTPEEVDTFIADARPDAYEQCVDRLLTTEPYRTRNAERMTAPWLDQARYADTCGIHMDAGRQMWLWRDWVLKAYRDNMPFDRFVREQIAGDLIEGATDDQKIASGFNRNHATTDEGGAIAEEYLVEYAVDRTATTGAVFLGLSVGCARCHDHKFDPIKTTEFYSLYSYFNSIEEPGLYSQTTDANRAHEPFISVPTPEQKAALASLREELDELRTKQGVHTPEEDRERATFFSDLTRRAGVAWAKGDITAATSLGGATLEPQPDGSIRAAGDNPKQDEYDITLRTDATGLRLIMLEALPEPTAPHGGPGRFENGNAVVTGITAEAVSVADPLVRKPIPLIWAWADHSQRDGDHQITNVLANDPARGWALAAHQVAGGRVALLLAQEAFGYEGGTDVRISIASKSMYERHNLSRVRLSLATLADAGVAMLPSAPSRWYVVGPFPQDGDKKLFDTAFGPEESPSLDFKRNFGVGNQYWRFDVNLADERPVSLAEGKNVSYVGRLIYSPVDRKVPVALGSDDGFRLFVNGAEVASHEIDRSVAPDQDQATLPLRAGLNTLVLKIVNTGGKGAYYYRASEEAELGGDLAASFVREDARSEDLTRRLERAWRISFLPSYKAAAERIASLEKQQAEINASMPKTMVMKELEKPRETFVLTRGQYDKPDKSRPVRRGIPAALGHLPDGAPENRLGLAQWLTSPDNPLVARVAVNRLWELAFGTGLVRTSEDFGQQGEWPSNPELLDWLAVEFRESGWDVRHMLKLIVTSGTYRQSSRIRPELAEKDPENRLLASYPRRRLTAEQIRDQALYVSGLLVERLGGPAVKPYQPDGLWQEVAMVQSNTREYKPGMGDEMWRRSLYTYWKRACPPPSLLTFDAPTREFCTIRRTATSTPLQALVLWNDEQFVEAARVLAQRTLAEPGDDAARLTRLFRRCAIRAPESRELLALQTTLDAFRERYRSAPDDALGLLKKGRTPVPPDADGPELAAWTMIANAMLDLYETTTQE